MTVEMAGNLTKWENRDGCQQEKLDWTAWRRESGILRNDSSSPVLHTISYASWKTASLLSLGCLYVMVGSDADSRDPRNESPFGVII